MTEKVAKLGNLSPRYIREFFLQVLWNVSRSFAYLLEEALKRGLCSRFRL